MEVQPWTTYATWIWATLTVVGVYLLQHTSAVRAARERLYLLGNERAKLDKALLTLKQTKPPGLLLPEPVSKACVLYRPAETLQRVNEDWSPGWTGDLVEAYGRLTASAGEGLKVQATAAGNRIFFFGVLNEVVFGRVATLLGTIEADTKNMEAIRDAYEKGEPRWPIPKVAIKPSRWSRIRSSAIVQRFISRVNTAWSYVAYALFLGWRFLCFLALLPVLLFTGVRHIGGLAIRFFFRKSPEITGTPARELGLANRERFSGPDFDNSGQSTARPEPANKARSRVTSSEGDMPM